MPKLATKATSYVLDKFEIKARARKGFTLFISNEDIDNIIKIVESKEKSGLLTDGATATVKLMVSMAASLIAPVASSLTQLVTSLLINAITGKRLEDGFLPLLTLLLIMKVLGKEVTRAGRGYKNMDKNFYFYSIL